MMYEIGHFWKPKSSHSVLCIHSVALDIEQFVRNHRIHSPSILVLFPFLVRIEFSLCFVRADFVFPKFAGLKKIFATRTTYCHWLSTDGQHRLSSAWTAVAQARSRIGKSSNLMVYSVRADYYPFWNPYSCSIFIIFRSVASDLFSFVDIYPIFTSNWTL